MEFNLLPRLIYPEFHLPLVVVIFHRRHVRCSAACCNARVVDGGLADTVSLIDFVALTSLELDCRTI